MVLMFVFSIYFFVGFLDQLVDVVGEVIMFYFCQVFVVDNKL